MYLIKITLLAQYNGGQEATMYVTDSFSGPYGLGYVSAKVFFELSLAQRIAKKVKDSYYLDYQEEGRDTHCAKVEIVYLKASNTEEV